AHGRGRGDGQRGVGSPDPSDAGLDRRLQPAAVTVGRPGTERGESVTEQTDEKVGAVAGETSNVAASNVEAADRLSTAPASEAERSAVAMPRLGSLELLRWTWRQLTSMRIALTLLFLLSVAAIPGSLLPQREIDPSKVLQYFAAHPG